MEFNVPSSLKPTSSDGVSKVVGPNSLEGRLAAKKGEPIPSMHCGLHRSAWAVIAGRGGSVDLLWEPACEVRYTVVRAEEYSGGC